MPDSNAWTMKQGRQAYQRSSWETHIPVTYSSNVIYLKTYWQKTKVERRFLVWLCLCRKLRLSYFARSFSLELCKCCVNISFSMLICLPHSNLSIISSRNICSVLFFHSTEKDYNWQQHFQGQFQCCCRMLCEEVLEFTKWCQQKFSKF